MSIGLQTYLLYSLHYENSIELNVKVVPKDSFEFGRERVIHTTSSAKICLVEEQTESSSTSCFHTFGIIFMAETAHEVTKMTAVDVHDRQTSSALIRRRASRAASEQGLRYFFRNKVPCRR